MRSVLKVIRIKSIDLGARLAICASMLFCAVLFVVFLRFPVQDESEELEVVQVQLKLVVITATKSPHYLSRSVAHVDRLRRCFDVKWIVVHTIENPEVATAPFFRDVFPWIKELRGYHAESSGGGHERNVAIHYLAEQIKEGNGFVYFADDDNVLPDLCGWDLQLHPQYIYVADQSNCGTLVSSTIGKDWSDNIYSQIVCLMSSGSFLVPLELIRETHDSLQFAFKEECGTDAKYFASLIRVWIQRYGPSRVVRLPVSLYFKHINDGSGCLKLPWTEDMLRDSYDEFKQLLRNMTEAQRVIAPSDRQKASPLSIHSYVHILSTIRAVLPKDRAIHFMEIGVWKGATSLLMSRHRYPTTVTGVDTFHFKNQRTEAEMIKRRLIGSGPINWISSHSSTALNATRESLQRLNVTGFDIILLDGDYSTQSLFLSDFQNYSALLAPGGFLVVDDFLETGGSHAVRESIWSLVRDGSIEAAGLDVLGVVRNVAGAEHEFKRGFVYDWQTSTSNDFIFRRRD
jgi:predicted O-methyltransferase YrrM